MSQNIGAGQCINSDVVPTAGTWRAGDICVNTGGTNTIAKFWLCIASGSPGTWVAVGGADTTGVGAKAGSTVSSAEYGDGVVHKTVLTLTATPITLTDDPGVGQFGSVKFYDAPLGNILFLGASLAVTITLVGINWIATAEGDAGLGTTATADATALGTTTQNLIPTTAIAAMVAKVGPVAARSVDPSLTIDGSSVAPDIYLNVRIDDNAAHTTAAGTLTGTITLLWASSN